LEIKKAEIIKTSPSSIDIKTPVSPTSTHRHFAPNKKQANISQDNTTTSCTSKKEKSELLQSAVEKDIKIKKGEEAKKREEEETKKKAKAGEASPTGAAIEVEEQEQDDQE
ncbi:unnamed protein product, partial [Amoebophrya sp. A25]